jgi:pimeloyl-ACP methyl ester carboxylesterase
MILRKEGIATANNINIWYETFGHRSHPAFLLMMGGCSQGILWPTAFCEMLAQLDFFVIRCDHRDVGLSTYFNFEAQPYNLLDMAKDAASLLDYLEIRAAHLFGLSMGGPIAELISTHYPNQVLTLNLISTSCDFRPMNRAYSGLPEETNYPLARTKDIYLHWMKNFLKESPTELEAQLRQRLDCWRILNGSSIPFEEELYREIHLQFLRRQTNLESLKNHLLVCQNSEQLIQTAPHKVKVPTLIFHGSEDVIFPIDHGEALAAAIPHSQYIPVEGMGHVLNKHFYNLILRELKKHAETGKSKHECLQC